jgi:hypothetical protein
MYSNLQHVKLPSILRYVSFGYPVLCVLDICQPKGQQKAFGWTGGLQKADRWLGQFA